MNLMLIGSFWLVIVIILMILYAFALCNPKIHLSKTVHIIMLLVSLYLVAIMLAFVISVFVTNSESDLSFSFGIFSVACSITFLFYLFYLFGIKIERYITNRKMHSKKKKSLTE